MAYLSKLLNLVVRISKYICSTRKPWLDGQMPAQERLSKLQNVFVWISQYICSTRKPWLDGRTSAEAEQTPLIRTAASYIFNANRIEAFHGRAYFFQNHHSYMIEQEINSRFSLYEFVTVDSVVVVFIIVVFVVVVVLHGNINARKEQIASYRVNFHHQSCSANRKRRVWVNSIEFVIWKVPIYCLSIIFS